MVNPSTLLLAEVGGATALAWLKMPVVWAAIALAVGLWCLIPQGRQRRWLFALGWTLIVIAVGLFGSQVPLLPHLPMAAMFWLLASVTVVAAVAMIVSRSPVYCAIWFALSLLGTAGLMLFNGAQFIGIATVVVYAGAIVVMFLFLIMLAQPDGHEYYDRITWSTGATWCSVFAGAAVVLMMTLTLARVSPPLHSEQATQIAQLLPQVSQDDDEPAIPAAAIADIEVRGDGAESSAVTVRLQAGTSEPTPDVHDRIFRLVSKEVFDDRLAPGRFVIESAPADQVASTHHVAGLGTELFSRRLLSIELAGTLLLVALVGAVAIVIRGREHEE